jgi:electron transport complex protein RnfG
MSNSKAAPKNETGEMIKNAMILFVITLIAGILLGLVYQITYKPINEQKAQKETNAYKAVLEAETFDEIDIDLAEADKITAGGVTGSEGDNYSSVIIDKVLTAKDASGNQTGYVLQISNKGYQDTITFSMGITNDGIMNGISLISIKDTPGLGMNAGKVIVPQFSGNSLAAVSGYTVVKDGTGKTDLSDNRIEAISGATITSKAINSAVNAGLLYYEDVLKGGQ